VVTPQGGSSGRLEGGGRRGARGTRDKRAQAHKYTYMVSMHRVVVVVVVVDFAPCVGRRSSDPRYWREEIIDSSIFDLAGRNSK
jgi:hypothetical protein